MIIDIIKGYWNGFSNHFRHSLKLLGIIIGVLIGAYLWVTHRLSGLLNPPTQAHAVLPYDVKERITYNDKKHILTIQTRQGTSIEYASSPQIIISNSNHVTIRNHLFALTLSPFVGVGYSNCPRIFVGVDTSHFVRLELHGELGISQDGHPGFVEPYIGVGYNVWSNTSLNVSVNPFTIYSVPQVAGFVSVKF